MSEQSEWKVCPDCKTPMRQIVRAPGVTYGCAMCGQAWDVTEVLEPDAKEQKKLGIEKKT